MKGMKRYPQITVKKKSECCLTIQKMRGIQYEDQVIYTTGITVIITKEW